MPFESYYISRYYIFCVKKVITFCIQKLLHFALNALLHFASILLHFALVLHFVAIITFCDVTRSNCSNKKGRRLKLLYMEMCRALQDPA